MKIEDTYKIPAIVSPDELKFLKDVTSRVTEKTGAVVNIGVYYGASSAALLLGMQEQGITGRLFCIDVFRYHNAGAPEMQPFRERRDIPWSDTFIDQAKANIAPFVGGKSVHYVQCFSDDFDLSMVDGISLVFIDADHSTHGCLLDALKFSQKVVGGGFMLFHDYIHFKSVAKAVAMFTEIRPDFKIESLHSSILIIKREANHGGD